jgi:hypothetical protein
VTTRAAFIVPNQTSERPETFDWCGDVRRV